MASSRACRSCRARPRGRPMQIVIFAASQTVGGIVEIQPVAETMRGHISHAESASNLIPRATTTALSQVRHAHGMVGVNPVWRSVRSPVRGQSRHFGSMLVTSGLPQLRTCRCTALTDAMCHKQSSHNATFGNAASLAGDDGFGSRSHRSRSSNAAFWHTFRLAIDDGISRTGTHGDCHKQCEPSA
jgi:hypothetical protein